MNYENEAEKLNKMRKKLEDLIDDHFELTHPEVIKLSKQLDDIIYKYQMNPKSTSPHDENKE